ncbi:hypothetical protein SAMN05421890_1620 [Ensifer adhaerens]|nr:hypothetical protein SAMN05421890_1620 [Ensifer adhaerens]
MFTLQPKDALNYHNYFRLQTLVRLGGLISMGNILTDTGAPYAVAIAIGAIGWLVTTGVAELKQSNITEYSVHKRTVGGENYIDLDLHNRSMLKTVESGYFTFRCNNSVSDDCFWKDNPIAFTPLNGVTLNSELDRSGPVYRATARLAPQSGIRYTVRTTAPSSDIIMFYEPADGDPKAVGNLIFRQGSSMEGWLIENYLSILLYILMALIGILLVWVLASAAALLPKWSRTSTDAQPHNPAAHDAAA